MKKEYSKPQINIESFELNESIAGPCAGEDSTIITNFHNAMCVFEWQDYFAENVCIEGDPGDIECTDTYIETEGYFWS
ncbi:hypothetical protein [Terrisporobacter sp.]